MKKLTIAAAALLAMTSMPAVAAPVVAVKITSASGSFLQVAELKAFAGATNVAAAANGSTATSFSSQFGFTGPDKATDGLTDGQPYGDGVYLSAGTGPGEYLLVTLQQAYSLSSLSIYGREDCCQERDLFKFQLLSAAGTVLKAGTLDARGQGDANVASIDLTGAVPEPATWAMMLLGFGMVGVGLRAGRRDKVTARVAFS